MVEVGGMWRSRGRGRNEQEEEEEEEAGRMAGSGGAGGSCVTITGLSLGLGSRVTAGRGCREPAGWASLRPTVLPTLALTSNVGIWPIINSWPGSTGLDSNQLDHGSRYCELKCQVGQFDEGLSSSVGTLHSATAMI